MKKLLSLILLTILTSNCQQLDCKAKPNPKIQIDDYNATVEPGATVSCSF